MVSVLCHVPRGHRQHGHHSTSRTVFLPSGFPSTTNAEDTVLKRYGRRIVPQESRYSDSTPLGVAIGTCVQHATLTRRKEHSRRYLLARKPGLHGVNDTLDDGSIACVRCGHQRRQGCGVFRFDHLAHLVTIVQQRLWQFGSTNGRHKLAHAA